MNSVTTILFLFYACTSLAQTPTPKKNAAKPKKPERLILTVPEPHDGFEDRETYVSVDTEPTPIDNVQTKVVYPVGIPFQGTIDRRVAVSALIDTNGTVVKTKIDHSGGPAFDSAAVRAVRQTRFTPARSRSAVGEVLVKMWCTVPVKF